MGKDLGARTIKRDRKSLSHVLRVASPTASASQTSHLSPTSSENHSGSPLSASGDAEVLFPSIVSQTSTHHSELSTTSADVHTQAPEATGNPSIVVQQDSITAVQAGPSVQRPLAVSLSARQLLNQRLQKYKLPAMFRADPIGPADNQRWKGTFWIKDTLIGASKLERSKAQAKEGAALSAIRWMNINHYY